jgi:hypothetical protein
VIAGLLAAAIVIPLGNWLYCRLSQTRFS